MRDTFTYVNTLNCLYAIMLLSLWILEIRTRIRGVWYWYIFVTTYFILLFLARAARARYAHALRAQYSLCNPDPVNVYTTLYIFFLRAPVTHARWARNIAYATPPDPVNVYTAYFFARAPYARALRAQYRIPQGHFRGHPASNFFYLAKIASRTPEE